MIGSLDEYVGRYGVLEEPGVEIAAVADGLVLRLPGAPSEFDAALASDEAGGPDRFRIAAGPLAGLAVTFSRSEPGAVSAIDIGGFTQLNWRPDADWPEYLFFRQLPAADTKASAFEALWAAAVEHGDGGLITYELAYPKHEFLGYLVEHKPVVLHGSNDPDIEHFEPRRRSLDGSPSGSKRAVYACTDGIWPLYFAVVDRKNYQGSLRNGVFSIGNERGERARVYYFSLSRDELNRKPGPWTSGTIYILPAGTFQQTRAADLPLEVASEAPVRPLANLAVSPEDFPFLHNVHGHDDSFDLRARELTRRLYAECREARALEDGYALRYDWSPEWAAATMEYIDIMRFGNPWRSFEIDIEPDGGPAWLTMRGSAALKDVIELGLAEARGA